MNRNECVKLIKDLYSEQLSFSQDDYLNLHSHNDAVIKRHIDSWLNYEKHVKDGRILDWGCKHAIDSCLFKFRGPNTLDLYGCDFNYPYEKINSYSKIKYKILDHSWKLPYENGFFDYIIASGVIEHVPMIYMSLNELYRILKADGKLFLTFIPNNFSYTEMANRIFGKNYHRRRFTQKKVKSLLLDHGFIVVKHFYHQFAPTLSGPNFGNSASLTLIKKLISKVYENSMFAEKFPVIRNICANIGIIARKVNEV